MQQVLLRVVGMGVGIGAGIRVGKQAGGIARKPGLGVDRIGAGLGHRQLIGVGAQDGLDGAVILFPAVDVA
jgi:hypothetical protein